MFNLTHGPGTEEGTYEVVYPIGTQVSQVRDVAPSIPDLNGKTICEVSNYAFRGEDSFPILEELMKKKFPGVNFVSYKEFGNIHDPSEEAERMAELPGKLKTFKCDAVIAGNGG